ncbi:BfmA/BtgA family mobilization protein [Flavivirga jejuensis]|uniref:BfmA/BtgA family mobilization protein n=1 Tax=Flavivirga jejuensis TaxID=870487 RepID=A0ABT8WUR9_9FLAO|nr:BfmA/BtgA family mobilization protein [Flavivirga jejuensis]MDO5976937.1 BfmA/BtgA family mobilization protein [Flavivirga jejuensis]
MSKNNKTYKFSAISIKDNVAVRFRLFSKKIAKSHTATLSIMMDFFEWHGFTPSDRFTQSLIQELLKNRARTETSIKRTEATIAIIRDIEVNQTKPNNAMLLSLFGEKIKEEKPIRVEKKFADKPVDEKNVVDSIVPKIRYEKLASKMENVSTDFKYVLDKVTTVKNSFGKDYLKLEISKSELENFIRTLKKL